MFWIKKYVSLVMISCLDVSADQLVQESWTTAIFGAEVRLIDQCIVPPGCWKFQPLEKCHIYNQINSVG